jgi:hypothetical protein
MMAALILGSHNGKSYSSNLRIDYSIMGHVTYTSNQQRLTTKNVLSADILTFFIVSHLQSKLLVNPRIRAI